MLIRLGHCRHCQCGDCANARAAVRAYHEQLGSKARWVPHIVLDGARFHVTSWDTFGPHCSEPRCEMNREHAKRKKQAQLRPRRLPRVRW